jgi:hypothetical protein
MLGEKDIKFQESRVAFLGILAELQNAFGNFD